MTKDQAEQILEDRFPSRTFMLEEEGGQCLIYEIPLASDTGSSFSSSDPPLVSAASWVDAVGNVR